MRLYRFLSVSLLAIGLATSAHAQSLKNARDPANLPPASFKGAQFVDNRGCVFIRAGHSGRVNWVPRVSRNRKQLCGLQPTFGTTKVASAPARTTTRVVQPKPKTVVRSTVRQPAPAVRTVRQPVVRQPVTTVRKSTTTVRADRRPITTLKTAPAPKKVVRTTPKKITRTAQRPQGTQLVGPSDVNRKIKEAGMRLPKGYKRAWTDGRLNPLRGVGTTSGKAQMELVWSNTVPRYLIDPATGKRVR